jgi:hypothetical protein
MLSILLLISISSAALIAVLEFAREPTVHPRFELPFSTPEDLAHLGEITQTGTEQQLQIASILRSRYFSLINSSFNANSTAFIKRTPAAVSAFNQQMSAFFGHPFQMRPIDLNESSDYILSPEKACARLSWLSNSSISKFEAEDMYQLLIKKVSALPFNSNKITANQVFQLGDYIISYDEQQKKLGFDIENDVKEQVKQVYFKYNEWVRYGSIEQGKLGLTEIFRLVNEYLKRVRRSLKFQQFVPFMMDEALFLALLHIFGLDYSPKPPGSAFFMEIHLINGKNTVRFIYNNQHFESVLFGVESSIEDFATYLESKIIRFNLKHTCTLIGGELKEDNTWKYIVAAGLFVVVVGMTWRYQKQEEKERNKEKKEEQGMKKEN